MERKKVLHILRMSEYSGAEKVAISIIKIFRNQYDMIYLATDGTIREKLEEEQVKYVLLEKFTRKNIKRAINKIRPDIVHAHDFTATLMIAGMKKDFRLISHLHQDPLWARKWNPKTLLFTAFLHRIDCLIVVSENALQNFVFKTFCQKNVKVIHNLIDSNEIYCLANNENGEKVYDLLFCGRFSEPKNPERFIDIVEEVVKDGVNGYLVSSDRSEKYILAIAKAMQMNTIVDKKKMYAINQVQLQPYSVSKINVEMQNIYV